MKHRATFTVAILLLLFAAGAFGQAQPVLTLEAGNAGDPGVTLAVPVSLDNGDHHITALVFSLDLDSDALEFNDADNDMNGIPDGIVMLSGIPAVTVIEYDADDTDGELDFLFAELSGASLPQGNFLRIELVSAQPGTAAQWIALADDPPLSFGDQNGQDVPGMAVVSTAAIFNDGFESADLSAWTEDVP